MKTETEVSHLVQPNADKSAPVGWVPGSGPGLFDKAPIWIDDKQPEVGSTVKMETLDGPIEYEVKEPSYVCYSGDADGPNKQDGWVQTVENVEKNYVL